MQGSGDGGFSGEDVAQAGLRGQAEQGAQGGVPQVGVHQDHPLAALGQDNAQVHDGR